MDHRFYLCQCVCVCVRVLWCVSVLPPVHSLKSTWRLKLPTLVRTRMWLSAPVRASWLRSGPLPAVGPGRLAPPAGTGSDERTLTGGKALPVQGGGAGVNQKNVNKKKIKYKENGGWLVLMDMMCIFNSAYWIKLEEKDQQLMPLKFELRKYYADKDTVFLHPIYSYV